MTATEIIEEISALPPAEQAEVVKFAYRLDAERQLSGPELSELAKGLVGATDPVQIAQLRAALTRGFYGGKPHA
jgi:hypothetical protein